jgi:hypothetical protein
MAAILVAIITDPALATQAHGAPEGIYSHQLAHVFFIFSMGVLIYWLRNRNLVVEKGWRYIQFSALFLILWNLDALFAHFLEEQAALLEVRRMGLWEVEIKALDPNRTLEWIYYLLKLDHLLCVPALIFLYAGLRRLISTVERYNADRGEI